MKYEEMESRVKRIKLLRQQINIMKGIPPNMKLKMIIIGNDKLHEETVGNELLSSDVLSGVLFCEIMKQVAAKEKEIEELELS